MGGRWAVAGAAVWRAARRRHLLTATALKRPTYSTRRVEYKSIAYIFINIVYSEICTSE
jgi:hypothetical protein